MEDENFDALVTVLDMYLEDEKKAYDEDPSDEHVYIYLAKLQSYVDNSKKVRINI